MIPMAYGSYNWIKNSKLKKYHIPYVGANNWMNDERNVGSSNNLKPSIDYTTISISSSVWSFFRNRRTNNSNKFLYMIFASKSLAAIIFSKSKQDIRKSVCDCCCVYQLFDMSLDILIFEWYSNYRRAETVPDLSRVGTCFMPFDNKI